MAQLPARTGNRITWAGASWDGSTIRVECRCQADAVVAGFLRAGTETVAVPDWKLSNQDGHLRRSELAWRKGWTSPFVIELTCEGEVLSVPVFDNRPNAEREDTLPSGLEVDADTAQVMLDRLLFEQYGGRLADSDEPSIMDTLGDASGIGPANDAEIGGDDTGDRNDPGKPDSFGVPAFELARQHFAVVDNWASVAARYSIKDDSQFDGIREDGERLAAAFRRQSEREERRGSVPIGAKVASEEMMLRLKLLRKT